MKHLFLQPGGVSSDTPPVYVFRVQSVTRKLAAETKNHVLCELNAS